MNLSQSTIRIPGSVVMLGLVLLVGSARAEFNFPLLEEVRSDSQPIIIERGRHAATVPKLLDAVVLDATGRHAAWSIESGMMQRGLPRWPVLPIAMKWLGSALRKDMRELARQCTKPMLVMTGDQDHIAPPSDAVAIADAAPRGRVVLFPGAAHLQSACMDVEAYRNAIDQFTNDLQ